MLKKTEVDAVAIAAINVWNRLNVATRQVAGGWMKSAEAQKWMENQASPCH